MESLASSNEHAFGLTKADGVSVCRVSFDELTSDPDLKHLLDQYAEASGMREIGKPCANLDWYRTLDGNQSFAAFAVRDSLSILVGFAVLVVSVAPHYSKPVAVVESIYAREGGRMLRRAVEDEARNRGAVALLMSAPAGSRAGLALEKQGMRVASNSYVKAL